MRSGCYTPNMTQSKTIRLFSLDDVRQIATDTTISVLDEVMVCNDVHTFTLPAEAMQLGFLVFCYCTAGQARFQLNARVVELQRGDLFLGLGEEVFSETSVSDDFGARMILVSRQCMQDGITGLHQLWPYLMCLYEQPVMHLTDEECGWVEADIDFAFARLNMTSHNYLRDSITALIRLFYFDICDILSRHYDVANVKQTGGYGLFDKFIQLLKANFRKERNVNWYSDKLCLTPKYLSEIVKAVSSKTAGQWITNFVILEIKQLLSNTNLSVKEIAHELNFQNQSFLGKYFKNVTGMSPSAYRKSLEKSK